MSSGGRKLSVCIVYGTKRCLGILKTDGVYFFDCHTIVTQKAALSVVIVDYFLLLCGVTNNNVLHGKRKKRRKTHE